MKKLLVLAAGAALLFGCSGNAANKENNLITAEGIENLKFTDEKPEFESPYSVDREYNEMDEYEFFVVRDGAGQTVLEYEPASLITIYSDKYVTEEGVSVSTTLADAIDKLVAAGKAPELAFDNGYGRFLVDYSGNIGLALDSGDLEGGYERFAQWWLESGNPALIGFDDFSDDAKITAIIIRNY